METPKETITRTFNLADRMGWQTMSLPRHQVKSLKIEFTKLKKGGGPHHDLCISELALFNGGRKISMAMPRAVMFYNGLEGCGASHLMKRTGVELDGIATDDGYQDKWSSNGRYVSGFNGAGGNEKIMYLWIADVWRGKIVRKIYRPDLEYHWQGNRLLVTSYGKSGFRRTIVMP